ncbi:Nuclear GTPase SLIP-GC [Colletotrichum shisoi]|uniref:Nuclear GTPase SLIP-GC n=1 Tax=Colletotrichum shisoi TaxID=2078593 RepID=A0A5Q4BXC9_9PEZI|nr:Nuclear GTPase SLIP-GC [Colletotrichum shisoi]
MDPAQYSSSMSLVVHEKLELAKHDEDATRLRDTNAKATQLLGDIQTALAGITGLKRAQNWSKSIEKLRAEYKIPRFVIGVLGDTGSGKSSLINAVLDEERVVPTNCMRACTAVITEISWNTNEDSAKKYRAEIEFITQAEWTTEVIALHRDILDLNGNLSPDIRNIDSDAGIAGVVLVDLPGGRDSNATRAAVAAKYVKECSRLWVVAPITRAVDDKTAKTLLGDHFKQQLKYDGAYNNITFICTKADDISLDEAAPSLGIEVLIAKEQERKTQTEKEIGEKREAVTALEPQISSLQETLNNISRDNKEWQGLRKLVSQGLRVVAPTTSPQKRKHSQPRTAEEPVSAKKVKKEFESSDADDTSDESELDDNDDADDDQPVPLTLEVTREKLDELKATKKAVKEEKKIMVGRMSQLKEEIKNLRKQRSDIKTNMHKECIQGRNMYSRDAIKQDFAFGLKEFDEELLAEQQQDGPPQAQVETDYEQIGNNLPVFCISSRGYQQLRNRMKKDQKVVGFTSLEDTEIPGLRHHTLELAAAIQASHFRHHLSEICRLLSALDLFVAGDAANLKLSDREKKQETENLEKSLAKLGAALGEVITRCMAECNVIVKKRILKKIGTGASNASEKAMSTAGGWGAKHDAGGLRYMTYKATCRRLGVFKGAAGPRDFNEELLKPLKHHTAHAWDSAFRLRLPEKLTTLATSMKHLIDAFHEQMKDRRFLVQNNDIVKDIIVKLLAAQKENLVHIGNEQQKMLQKSGKHANRLFGPAIQTSMLSAYNGCVLQQGIGSFIVMKDIMSTHVESTKNTMFKTAARDVENAVNNMLRSLESTVKDDTNNVIIAMQEDYIGLIGEVATEADNRARKTLSPLLREFYKKLDAALTPAPQEDAASQPIDLEMAGGGSEDEYRPDSDESD